MIRFAVISALIGAFPCSVAAEDSTDIELTVGSFSARPDSFRNSPTVEIKVVLVIETGNVRHYRLDRLRTERQGSATTASADSRTCSAVLEQLAKVEGLPMPTFVAPGAEQLRSITIMIHPTSYTLEMGGYESESNTGARIELSAQSGSPLARWTEETLKALEPCWSNLDS